MDDSVVDVLSRIGLVLEAVLDVDIRRHKLLRVNQLCHVREIADNLVILQVKDNGSVVYRQLQQVLVNGFSLAVVQFSLSSLRQVSGDRDLRNVKELTVHVKEVIQVHFSEQEWRSCIDLFFPQAGQLCHQDPVFSFLLFNRNEDDEVLTNDSILVGDLQMRTIV